MGMKAKHHEPGNAANHHALHDDGPHDLPVDRSDGAHYADFNVYVPNTFIPHRAHQPHAADHSCQEGHDKQEGPRISRLSEAVFQCGLASACRIYVKTLVTEILSSRSLINC